MTIGVTDVWQLKNAPTAAAFFFASGLSVDADGAPNAYGPPGVHGTLDYLGNAGEAGNWWALVTDKRGQPVVQNGVAPQQPYRGFYISTTLLHDDFFPGETDVRHWADATRIPYIALPNFFHGTGLKLGDVALLINGTNGKHCFAIFADSKGRKPKLGEVSICAAAALGAPSDPRHGGMSRGLITLVFPDSGLGQGMIPGANTIAVSGRGLLEHFSKYRDKDSKLPTAFPEYPLFATALTDAGYLD
jgi:hypothetical protein